MYDTQKIDALAREVLEEVIQLRRQFHQQPELSFREVKTARLISQKLDKMGVEVTPSVGTRTSLVGTIRGMAGDGPCVLLRADMDGLPIVEDMDNPYRSKVSGVMHACGHDGHMAGLLGTAKILTRLRREFPGSVKLAFEAGAENGGALAAMIRAGLLENPTVDVSFCTHFFGTHKEGELVFSRQCAFIAADTVQIEIMGNSGRDSMPHLSIDPVAIAAQVITTAQQAISRTIDPLEIGLLTFCTIHGGELFNVLPAKVRLTGSIRSSSSRIQQKIHQVLENLLEGITAAYGAKYTISYSNCAPESVNDPRLVEWAARRLQATQPGCRIQLRDMPELSGETFSHISHMVPSVYYVMGVENEQELPLRCSHNHSGSFRYRDENLLLYMKTMTQLTVDFLREGWEGVGVSEKL